MPFEIPQLELVGLQPVVKESIDEAMIALRGSPADASKAGDLGMVFFNAGCPQAAASCFEYAAGLEPTAMRWRYYLGLSHVAVYNSSAAAEAFERARELDAQYAPILVELGGLRLKSDVPAARQLFQQATERNPREPRGHFGLGECARLRGDFAAAIPHYQKALELSPTYADAHQALAQCLESTGKKTEARRHRAFRAVGGSQPSAEDPLLVELLSRATAGSQLIDLARALTEAGKVAQAIETLETVVAKDGSDMIARGALGLLLDLTGQQREAVQQFRAILEKQPNDFPSVLNLAKALTEAGEYEEGERYYLEVLNSEPRNSRALSLFGWHLMGCGRMEEAAKYFERWVQLKPDEPESHLALALALTCLTRYEAAADQYRRANMLKIGKEDTFARFLWNLAEALMRQQRYMASGREIALTSVRSVSALADVLDTKQMSSEAAAARAFDAVLLRRAVASAQAGHFANGLDYVRLGLADEENKTKAGIIEEIKKNVAAKPEDINVRHLLAIVLVDIGERSAAKEHWQQIIKVQPRFVLAYIALAVESMYENDFAQARGNLEAGLQHEPDSPWLSNALAWVLATCPEDEHRDAAAALRWAQKACQATGNKNPVFLDTLAAAHAATGNFSEAVRVEGEAIRFSTEIGQTISIPVYRERLELYENKKPYVQRGKRELNLEK
ncbi:MAG TPA: tetratricopeptide repeat protein [Phycisphaerae bacterium]|nr:tetratricopeptide repeat protein [Phycisphaerae bacterium]